MPDYISELKARLARIHDLESAAALLEWDQETYMPRGAALARAEQLATIRQLAYEQLTSDRVGALIEKLDGTADPDSPDGAIVRVTRRDYDRATRLPDTLVARLSKAVSLAKEAWKNARAENRFETFAPHLEVILELNREKAESLGYSNSIYDPLLDEFEPDTTTAEITALFAQLRSELVPIVRTIAKAEAPEGSVLRRHYPAALQEQFGLEVVSDLGFDFTRGRQDLSAHPFTTRFSINDVRLTTRINEAFFAPAFFGTLHEAGHGLYEQGIDPRLERTPLATGTSLGMHESQSRLWENLVGRSRAFWAHYLPQLKHHFGSVLEGIDKETFYRAINRVQPSLIRVEADEVTYNLHIMLRFELEVDLLEGRLTVSDVPDAWNDRMHTYLGLTPPDDSRGALQDIHWSLGTFGYFPTYTLGNLMSVQLFESAASSIGDLHEQISRGQFGSLLAWLRDNVHRFGRARSASKILSDACGSPLSAAPWLKYIRTKYSEIYGRLP